MKKCFAISFFQDEPFDLFAIYVAPLSVSGASAKSIRASLVFQDQARSLVLGAGRVGTEALEYESKQMW